MRTFAIAALVGTVTASNVEPKCTTLLSQGTGVFKSVNDWINSSGLKEFRDNGEKYRGDDGKFEFKITWNDGKSQHWKQSNNPMVHPGCSSHCGVQGYSPIKLSSTLNGWGGLEYSGSSAVLDGTVSHGNWYYAVGSTNSWQSGIPAAASAATSVKFEVCSKPTRAKYCHKILTQGEGVFKSIADWSKGLDEKGAFSRLDDMTRFGDKFRGKDGKYEFKITWDNGKSQHWKQTSNPMMHPGCSSHCGVQGYSPIELSSSANSWGGLEYSGNSATLDGTVNSGNWYYAVGSNAKWSSGIPAAASAAKSVRFEACTDEPQIAIPEYECKTLLHQKQGVFKSVKDWINSSGLTELRDNGDKYRGVDGKFEFKIHWNDGKSQHWTQESNPMVHPGCSSHCGVKGYSPIKLTSTLNGWGGLEYSGNSAVLDGTVSSGNWYYAVGSTNSWQSGIPAAASAATSVRFEACYPKPIACQKGTSGGWSSCSTKCGPGSQSRTRSGDVAPQFGGAACPSTTETRACNAKPCPIDCVEGTWGKWSTCTKQCGSGQQSRTRIGDVVAKHGGKACSSAQQAQACNAQPCPINGKWSNWSLWGSCSMSCDGGVSTRTRSCVGRAYGGKDCVGASTDSKDCNAHLCACPTCEVKNHHIIIDHKVAINKAGAHGPRTIHAQCKSNTGACTSSLVIAHVCKATNLCKPGAKTCVDTHAQCACTCKKPTDGQSRDHHVITQLPNQFDLTNNQRKPIATTMAIGEEGRKVKK